MVATRLLTPLTFDNTSLPREQQFEAWRAYQASVIDVSPSTPTSQGFAYKQDVWHLGQMAFASAQLPGPLVPRNWKHLRKDPLDHWCLVLPDSKSVQPGDHPRQLHIRSLGRPFEGAAVDSSVSTMFIPRDLLRSISGVLDGHSGSLETSGLGGVLSDFFIALERRLPTIEAKDMARVVDGVRALIVACLAPTADRLCEASPLIATTVLERARQVVHKNLHSPRLGADLLCAQLGISRSKLYRLFEPMNGVSRYILRQRLVAAHKALSDPLENRSMATLADHYCFPDAATFSRAFRKEMGCSPSEVRAEARGGRPPLLRLPAILQGMQLTDLSQVLWYLQV